MANILEQAIPGFSGLTSGASQIIQDAMSGRVPGDVQRIIRDRAAVQAQASGMPGAGAGSLHGNLELRDLGLTSLGQKQQGFNDLLQMLTGFSGTAAPTFGQLQDNETSRAVLSAAPDPAAAAAEQERLFNKYSRPAAGTTASAGGGASPFNVTWFQNGMQGIRRFNPLTGSYGAFTA